MLQSGLNGAKDQVEEFSTHVWTRHLLQVLFVTLKQFACMYPACSWANVEYLPAALMRFAHPFLSKSSACP